MKHAVFALLCTCLALAAAPARAEGENVLTAGAGAGKEFSFGSLFKTMRATYSGLLEGPRLDHLDGNLDGKGTFLQIKNYLNADIEVAKDWRIELNGEFRQFFRPDDPRRPDQSSFEWRDPSIGVARRNIVDSGSFSLAARARYAIPVSADTKSRVGRTFDTGNGSFYVQAVPSWRWMDGKLTLFCPVESYINLPKQRVERQEQLSVKAKAQFAYQMARKWAARVEYSTGDVRLNNQGTWSKLNAPFLGHKVMAGAAYAPVKQIVINPSLTWGRGLWQLNKPEVTLFVSYNFL